jgi:predicted RNase H-like nuclease (RuvC/YqgF family)
MHTTNAPAEPAKVDTEEEAMNAVLAAQVSELQTKLTAIEAEKAELSAASAQATEAVTAEVDALKSEVDRLTNEVATRDAEIAKLQAESKSAGEQAAAIVAAAGIDPNGTELAQPTKTAAQVFASLSGHEATEYFRQHQAAIIATFNS